MDELLLVVAGEDDAIRNPLLHRLIGEGFRVVFAADGDDAFAVLKCDLRREIRAVVASRAAVRGLKRSRRKLKLIHASIREPLSPGAGARMIAAVRRAVRPGRSVRRAADIR